MASRGAHKRLTHEYKSFQASPPPFIEARPNESNILEWHYVITGPPDTPYAGGQYHGTLTFPADYPFKPPAIRMFTPSGRFRPGMRLCLSISDYHPDTWNPAWSVSTILTGLLSFMVEEETTAGSMQASTEVRRRLARDSKQYNVTKNAMFVAQYPDVAEKNKKELAPPQAPAGSSTGAAAAAAAGPSKKRTLEPVTLAGGPSTETQKQASDKGDEPAKEPRFSKTQKIACVAVLFVSWLVASKLFASHV